MGGADVDVASRLVYMSYRRRQLCYPQGSFSVITSTQRKRHCGSLSPAFAPAFVSFTKTVKLTFAFTLYSGVLTRLS